MIPKKVLLIENDKKFLHCATDLLKSHNYSVDIACSGADALVRMHHGPHIVLISYFLPDTRGMEICKQIRADERWHGVPILVLTDSTISLEEMEGLYIYGDDHISKPCDPDELLARIEIALRQKNNTQGAEEREIVIHELDSILKEERIVPYFQPIYTAPSLDVFGVEALSRPVTKTSLSNPELFFRAALAFGAYTDIEKLAWRKAFKQWQERLGQGKLFLNCTPYFIGNNSMNKEFFAGLGVDPQHVVLELTERTAIHNHDIFVGKLNELRALGMKIAVDDVGSGFASLDTVAEVRPDYIKIDLKLIRNISFDSLKRNIVQSIITFCRQSNIKTVAEGIEEKAELQIVLDLGIDAVQGYLLGKPSPDINKEIFGKKPVV